jgi:hypothetical protein
MSVQLSGCVAALPQLDPAHAGVKVFRARARQPRLVLRSRIPGRERWHVKLLEDNPRLAAAVELVLRSEEGLDEVRVNPLTGRVLVRYRPDSTSKPIEEVLRGAMEAGPLSREEFAALRKEQPRDSVSRQVLTAEIACCLSHVILFGGICPLGLLATGALLLLHRNSSAHAHG